MVMVELAYLYRDGDPERPAGAKDLEAYICRWGMETEGQGLPYSSAHGNAWRRHHLLLGKSPIFPHLSQAVAFQIPPPPSSQPS